ncbi:MAG: NAD-binding protein, partial [Pseudomonadota bacterium]
SLNAYTPLPGVGVESPADKDYAGGFATPLMVKDLRLAMGAAESADAAVPLGARAAALYEDFLGAGNEALDFSAIIKTYS